ncbi:g7346 [Coccomyxa viridis]|uniref:glutathione gamma-glutamylcysteinyltransferase n=1 Tax=Coccomyxa viridis TaxID=1274662 RepID=A0ABP1G067_9CHLO
MRPAQDLIAPHEDCPISSSLLMASIAASPTRTFYKRQLPCPPAVGFSSPEAAGKALLAEAMLKGTMEGFFKLIEQYRTQDEPSFCGLASLAMVLNTLQIDPRRAWKGPWRWFHEEMLDCCLPIAHVVEGGIVLDQAACLARCNGARVELHRAGSFSLEEFREAVRETSTSETEHLIASYSRKEFLQTGDGHFSPLGGYHEDKDMVLILDTASFKYPLHWVPLESLFRAMQQIDPVTSKARGFLRMGAQPRLESVLFTLRRCGREWRAAAEYWHGPMQRALERSAATSAEEAVQSAVAGAPLDAVRHFVACRETATCTSSLSGSCTQPAVVSTLLRELQQHRLYALVEASLKEKSQQEMAKKGLANGRFDRTTPHHYSSGWHDAERVMVYLLLAPVTSWEAVQSQELDVLLEVRQGSILETELEYLRCQQRELPVLDHFDTLNAECSNRCSQQSHDSSF